MLNVITNEYIQLVSKTNASTYSAKHEDGWSQLS